MAGLETVKRVIALFQASYPTRRLTKEMLGLATIAYARCFEDLADEVLLKAAAVAVREDDSAYRDWPSPGQVRAIAERMLGVRVSGFEAARLAAQRLRTRLVGPDEWRYSVDVEGLSPEVAEALREALRVFGYRRFAEMGEDKRVLAFARVYDEVSRRLRERRALGGDHGGDGKAIGTDGSRGALAHSERER